MMTDDTKERIKLNTDIVEVINSYVPLKRAGNNFKGLCPFHQEKTPSFTVTPAKQFYYCYGCQRGGDVFSFIMEHEGVDFVEAMKLLARRAGIEMPEFTPQHARRDQPSLPRGTSKNDFYTLHEQLTAWYGRNLQSAKGAHALAYLRERGVPEVSIRQFGLGYAPDSWRDTLNAGRQLGYNPETMLAAGILTKKEEADPVSKAYDRFRDRLMFPIADEQGRVVGFSGRVLSESAHGGKYVNSPETALFRKGMLLYGLHHAREGIKTRKYALLCEGQLDVIRCHEAGLTNAVAPQGTAFTETQARLLKRYTDTVVLAFDADNAGLNAALKSIDAFLPAGLSAKVALFEPGSDPDSLVQQQGPEALHQKIDAAHDYFDFLLDMECRRYDLRTADGKAAAAQGFLAAVARLNSAVARSQHCQNLAARLQLPAQAVFDELRSLVRRQQRPRWGAPAAEAAPVAQAQPPPLQSVGPAASPAELTLLEIAMHHRDLAHRLAGELPPDAVSQTVIGEALNLLMAHTLDGEWQVGLDEIHARVAAWQSSELNRLVCAPSIDYGPEADAQKLEKAFVECLQTHRASQLNAERDRVTTTEPDRRKRQERLLEMKRQQAQLGWRGRTVR